MKPSTTRQLFFSLRFVALLAAFFGLRSLASAQDILWSAQDATNGVSSDWSDPLNWLGGAVPGAGNVTVFGNPGQSATTTTPDNIVDVNLTIASLWYAATNLSPNFTYHNTQINSGVTLSVLSTNAEVVLDSGTQNDPAVSPAGAVGSYATISGPGELNVVDTNSQSVAIVSQGSSSYTGDNGLYGLLDMSKLATFNGTFGRLLVGLQGVGPTPNEVSLNSSGRQTGLLALAQTNVIHLTQTGNVEGAGLAAVGGPALVLNDAPFWGDDGSYIYLGQSNALWADSICIGRIGCSRTAIMEINPSVTGPSQFWLRGQSSNRVSLFVVADTSMNGVYANNSPNYYDTGVIVPQQDLIVIPPGSFQVAAAGAFDVTLATSDMMIDTLIIGKGFGGGGGGYAAGIFNMGAGTLDVNTLQLGVVSGAGETAPSTGMFNVAGGSVIVNSSDVALGLGAGAPIQAYATGILTLGAGASLNVANGSYGIVDDGLSLSEVLVTNSSITAGYIGTPAAPVGTIVLSDATLNLTLNGLEGSVVSVDLTTGSTNLGNTINITSIASFVGEQSVVTLIQSDSPINDAGSVTNWNLGTLPAGYQGHLQITASAVQLVITQSPVTPNTWATAGDWSVGTDWSSGSEPGPDGVATFGTGAAVGSSALSTLGGGPGSIISGNVNNTVNQNVSILGLDYENINGTYQNTSIDSGVTLTVGLGGLTVGSPVVDEGNTSGNATISGPSGTLAIDNSDALIYVGLGHDNASSSAEATLDMSGLGTFNADVGSFLVGVGGGVEFATVLQPAGTVYLAQSNMITVNSGNGQSDNTLVALDVGDAGDAETTAGYGDTVSSALYLGWTNAIWADYIDIGRQWASGSIAFNPSVTNSGPSAYIRGVSATAVATWNIGDGAQNTLASGAGTGTADFSGGTINAMVDTLGVAVSSPNSTAGSSVVKGTLKLDAGTIWAGTVNISDNPATAASPADGIVTVDGTGTLAVSGTLNLGLTPGTPFPAPSATLNIGGTVWANFVAAGTNSTISAINISGGLLGATNGIGAPSAPVTSLNLTNSTIVEGASVAPFISAASVNLGGSSNMIQILALPAIEQYPVSYVLLKSAAPISGSFNLQAVAPVAYSGVSLSESSDHTQVTVTIQNGPTSARGIVHWVGPNGGNTNWSDALNWFIGPIPGVLDTALFDNTGESGSESTIDNQVDASDSIAALWYAATNASPNFEWHNTGIAAGVTLTVSNNAATIVLDSGTQSDTGSAGTTTSYSSINGAGTLDVVDTNVQSVAIVSQGSSTYGDGAAGLWAALDMSELNTFECTVGRLLLGVQGNGPSSTDIAINGSGRQYGILSLALTNSIYLTQTGNNQGGYFAANGGAALVVGDTPSWGDNGSILNLGVSNAIWADTVAVGRNGVLTSAQLQFNVLNPAPGLLWLRGTSSNRVSEFVVADDSFQSISSQYEHADPRISLTPATTDGLNVSESAIVDLSGGTSDIMIDILAIGKGYTAFGAGYTVGQLNLGLGTLNANTIQLGVIGGSGATGAPVTGILNITGGTVIANTELDLGLPIGAGTVAMAAGEVNVTNGTIEVANLVASGNVNSEISISGGTLSLISGGTIGSPAAPVGSITLSGGTTLNLAVGTFPAVVASTLNASGTADTINLTALPAIPTVPSTNTLIQLVTGPISGYDFALGSPLPTGYKGYIQASADGTAVQLVVTNAQVVPTRVTITTTTLLAGNIVLSGTNGLSSGVYYVLESTNLINWTPISTNNFNVNGDFSVSLPTSNKEDFFKIESQ